MYWSNCTEIINVKLNGTMQPSNSIFGKWSFNIQSNSLIQTWCMFHSIARALISIFNIGFPTKLKASLWALNLGGTIENDDQLITNSTWFVRTEKKNHTLFKKKFKIFLQSKKREIWEQKKKTQECIKCQQWKLQNKSIQFIIIKQSRTKHMTQHLQRHGPLHLLMWSKN